MYIMSDLVDGLPSLDDVSTMIGALLDHPDFPDDSIREWYVATAGRGDLSTSDIDTARAMCVQHRVPGRRTGGALNHACNVYLSSFVRGWIRHRRPAWTPAEVDSCLRTTLDADVLVRFTASVTNVVVESLRVMTDLDYARVWRDPVDRVAHAPHFLAVRLSLQHVARECIRAAHARAESVPRTPEPRRRRRVLA
jgi:hypothetical protein